VHLLEQQGWQGAIARDFSSNEILVRVKEFSDDPAGLGEKMKQDLMKAQPDNPVTIQSNDSIGPGVGAEYRSRSLIGIIVGLIAMMIYIALRFRSLAFATGAFVSLFHDAIVILAMYLFFDKEISVYVIGAILTVLGYSINDTIVIFARIRENIAKLRGTPIEQIVNISINETLRRTLLTTFATLLVVVALLLFGGETLRSLSLALLVGMVFGVYSTIYIASPVMLLLYK
jgi:preprotein translocase subunit SecF